MKLRTKLLLGVAILLLAMAILMYFLPTFFIRKDVYQAADAIHRLLVADHEQVRKSQETWLNEAFSTAQENNNALLFMIYQEPSLNSQLRLDANEDKKLWKTLAKVASYDPTIGFVQIHDPNKNKVAGVSTDQANLYTVDRASWVGNHMLISLLETERLAQDSLIGIPLPQEMQIEPGYTLLALIDSQEMARELPQVKAEIAKLLPTYAGKKLSNQDPLISQRRWKNRSSFIWGIKIDMIRALTPLYVEGLELSEKTKRVTPKGLARLDQTGNGYVILTEEVFFRSPLFDDVKYYKLNQPGNAPPIAEGSKVVVENASHEVFIANTLLLQPDNYLSLGTSLAFLAKNLALSTNKIVLFQVNDFWIGVNQEGNQLHPDEVAQMVRGVDFHQNAGKIQHNQTSFYYTKVASLDNDQLVFYTLQSFDGEKSIVSTLLSLEDRLSRRISMQLSLIALGTIILVLLFIGRIGFTVIYPVTKLAKATEDVVAGRYDEVALPDVGERKDEVAILTRSFGSMVNGLKEREKIRGVLDKVVSKDVADEILKSNIHLGGEDRIVTMLFSDIRQFTNLTANLSPQKTIEVLNACMTKVSRVVEGEGGVIDKYVGDEVMAIYGAPTTHPDHALRAVSSGMLILETLKKWNKERIAAGELPIEMGIGIHSGLVVAGNMGAEDRLNYTVLGHNVNLAARLCEVAKPNQMIISEGTLAEPNIKESFYVKSLSPISLKGFTMPVKIFEVTGFKWEEDQEIE